MPAAGAIPASIIVLLATLLYSRSAVLYTFYANAPASLVRVNELAGFQVLFKDLLHNCEDLYLNDDEGWALLSCDPGRDTWNTVMGVFVDSRPPPETGLYLYRYGTGVETVPEKVKLEFPDGVQPEFHPLGLDYHPASRTIFVANHASSGRVIEVFNLNTAQEIASHVKSLEHPKIAAPNSIAAVSSTEFFMTNDHFFPASEHPLLSKVETYSGIQGGSVVHVRFSDAGGISVQSLARVSFANGVVLLNESTLAVASTISAAVYLYTILPGPAEQIATPVLKLASTISLGFLPDNLSVDSRGHLLIAGHPHAPSIEHVAKNNRFCNTADSRNEEQCRFARLSWISEWSEKAGLRTLYAGDEYGTSTSAVRDVSRGVGFASGLYERGLLTWKL